MMTNATRNTAINPPSKTGMNKYSNPAIIAALGSDRIGKRMLMINTKMNGVRMTYLSRDGFWGIRIIPRTRNGNE